MTDRSFHLRTCRSQLSSAVTPIIEALELRQLLEASVPVDTDPAPDHVAEDAAAAGTSVGIAASSTSSDGAPITFTLADDAAGRFAIDPMTGIVTVADAALLDGPATHEITVAASDGAGGTATEYFVIAVQNEASAPLQSDRGRVQVVRNQHGYLTVHSDQGTSLRGGTAFVYETGRRTGKTAYISDPAYYRNMRENGLNAVRLIAFDPYQRTRDHNHADLDDPVEVATLLNDFDTIVDLASKEGMYVIINYHDVGGYEKPYLWKFWDLVAPRYRNRTHVAYELMNEPVRWFPEHYTDQHLADIKSLYDRVRRHAPNTHQILLTFANTASYDPNTSIRAVTERLSATGSGIDWTNASVGFHTYQTKKTSQPIVDLVQHFPGINTEQNLPYTDGAVPMDGEEYGVQTMERLGLSWCHWRVHGPENFSTNYLGRILSDAIAKSYLWDYDAVETPDANAAESQ